MRTIAAQKEHTTLEDIMKKIKVITEGCSKPYFNKTLVKMTETSLKNCHIICEYILAEQTEINLKDSTAIQIIS
jgi:hypothetical protein